MTWKTDQLRYICETIGDEVRLTIRCYFIGLYPLSYTTQECLEEFCEKVGWHFIMATQNQCVIPHRVAGLVSLRRPSGMRTLSVLQDKWLNRV